VREKDFFMFYPLAHLFLYGSVPGRRTQGDGLPAHVNVEKEYQLIHQKRSMLSASMRRKVVAIYEGREEEAGS
jgi:hypothetical protein